MNKELTFLNKDHASTSTRHLMAIQQAWRATQDLNFSFKNSDLPCWRRYVWELHTATGLSMCRAPQPFISSKFFFCWLTHLFWHYPESCCNIQTYLGLMREWNLSGKGNNKTVIFQVMKMVSGTSTYPGDAQQPQENAIQPLPFLSSSPRLPSLWQPHKGFNIYLDPMQAGHEPALRQRLGTGRKKQLAEHAHLSRVLPSPLLASQVRWLHQHLRLSSSFFQECLNLSNHPTARPASPQPASPQPL